MDNKIAEIRHKKNLTQEKLSKLAQITRPYLSEIENGKSNPSHEIAVRISKSLKEPLEVIFFDADVNQGLQNSI